MTNGPEIHNMEYAKGKATFEMCGYIAPLVKEMKDGSVLAFAGNTITMDSEWPYIASIVNTIKQILFSPKIKQFSEAFIQFTLIWLTIKGESEKHPDLETDHMAIGVMLTNMPSMSKKQFMKDFLTSLKDSASETSVNRCKNMFEILENHKNESEII